MDVNEIDGQWIRHRYSLVNGCVVPDSETHTKYDPWSEFRLNLGKYRTIHQPYIDLLELGQTLSDLESRGIVHTDVNTQHFGPRNMVDETILEWCREHGLLGLLPGLSDSIRLSSTGPEYYRLGGIWREYRSTAARPAVFTWLDLFSRRHEQRRAEEIAVFHAPTGRTGNPLWLKMACPLSQHFWKEYCEPLSEIAWWASLFAKNALLISRWQARGTQNADTNEDDLNRAYGVMLAVAQPVAPTFQFIAAKRDRLDQVSHSPSLLSSYALMFLLDRTEGRRAIICENCRTIFVSNEDRARYCSPACRNRANVRKSTERSKTKSKKVRGKK